MLLCIFMFLLVFFCVVWGGLGHECVCILHCILRASISLVGLEALFGGSRFLGGGGANTCGGPMVLSFYCL